MDQSVHVYIDQQLCAWPYGLGCMAIPKTIKYFALFGYTNQYADIYYKSLQSLYVRSISVHIYYMYIRFNCIKTI